MVRLVRKRHETRHGAVTLASREWAVLAGGPGFGGGVSYVGPSRVVSEDAATVRIVDHLLVARLAVVMAVVLALMLRSVRRD